MSEELGFQLGTEWRLSDQRGLCNDVMRYVSRFLHEYLGQGTCLQHIASRIVQFLKCVWTTEHGFVLPCVMMKRGQYRLGRVHTFYLLHLAWSGVREELLLCIAYYLFWHILEVGQVLKLGTYFGLELVARCLFRDGPIWAYI
jgi:hypothetical protein